MCSFGEKKSEPTEMMQLDGYTVDYTEAIHGMFEGGGDGTTGWVHSGCP